MDLNSFVRTFAALALLQTIGAAGWLGPERAELAVLVDLWAHSNFWLACGTGTVLLGVADFFINMALQRLGLYFGRVRDRARLEHAIAPDQRRN